MKPYLPVRMTRAALVVAVTLVAAGCASTQLDAQWSNPQRAAVSLRGTKVLVVCEAAETMLRQICQDKLSTELATLGAVPVRASDAPVSDPPQGESARHVAAARAAGATAVFSVTVSPDASQATSTGVSVGFGVGGFGFGRGFGGVGLSAPVGESRIAYGYAGNGSLLDADSGTLMWTAKTRSNPADNTEFQMAYLAKALAEGAQKAGYL